MEKTKYHPPLLSKPLTPLLEYLIGILVSPTQKTYHTETPEGSVKSIIFHLNLNKLSIGLGWEPGERLSKREKQPGIQFQYKEHDAFKKFGRKQPH